jgi:hypothetical protein
MTEDEHRFLMNLAYRRMGLLEARILEDQRFGPMVWIGQSESPQDRARRHEIEDRERDRINRERDEEGE